MGQFELRATALGFRVALLFAALPAFANERLDRLALDRLGRGAGLYMGGAAGAFAIANIPDCKPFINERQRSINEAFKDIAPALSTQEQSDLRVELKEIFDPKKIQAGIQLAVREETKKFGSAAFACGYLFGRAKEEQKQALAEIAWVSDYRQRTRR